MRKYPLVSVAFGQARSLEYRLRRGVTSTDLLSATQLSNTGRFPGIESDWPTGASPAFIQNHIVADSK